MRHTSCWRKLSARCPPSALPLRPRPLPGAHSSCCATQQLWVQASSEEEALLLAAQAVAGALQQLVEQGVLHAASKGVEL